MLSSRGLPVSRVVDVQVTLAPLQAQAVPINTCLLLGTSTVIDPVERIREYASIAEVAQDFGTTATEYLAALLWFGQSPQPNNLFIGRWVKTASQGKLIGGGVAAADLLSTAWTGITDGSFRISINAGVASSGYNLGAALDASERLIANWNIINNGAFTVSINGTPHNVTGLDLTGVFFLEDVAAVVTAALTALVAGTTCTWDGLANQFKIISGTTGASSAISYLSTEGTGTDISGMLKMRTGQGTLVAGAAAGAASNITGLNFSAITNMNGVASVVQAALNASVAGTTCVYDANFNRFVITAPGTGTTSTVSFLSAEGSGTDVSGMLSGLSTSSGAYLSPGLAAETAVSAVALFDLNFAGQWYALVIPDADDADHEAVAAYVEAASPPHYYGLTTSEAGTLIGSDTSDIAYILSELKYNKSAVQYSSTSPYAIMSYLARILTTAWLGQNTTITLKFKAEPGVIAETVNTTEADSLDGKHCNAYVNYNNGVSFIQEGQSASGQFTDTVIGADWLAGEVQTQVFNRLYGSTTKIPQTDAGMGILINAAESACIEGVNNGFIAPGVWFSGGFGTLSFGDTLSKGFYVWAPPVATQSEAIRQTRAAPVMQLAIKTAGAIHSSLIEMTVLQ